MPILPLISLVPNLPRLMRHFASVPGHDFLVPMIITVPSIGIVLLAPLAGAFADRWWRRRLLLCALALFSVASLTPLLLDDLQSILVAQSIVGIGEAIIMTVANTLLGDYFDSSGPGVCGTRRGIAGHNQFADNTMQHRHHRSRVLLSQLASHHCG
jgi:MFS family permease